MAQSSNKLIILDVRTPQEFSESHVETSLNIDFLAPTFLDKVAKLDRNQTYKLYCRSGNRSGKAAEAMKDLGFKDVENLGTLDEASTSLGMACVK